MRGGISTLEQIMHDIVDSVYTDIHMPGST